MTRTTDGADGRFFQSIYQTDPGAGRKAKSTTGIQWACGACAGAMASSSNMRDRILVLFSCSSPEPKVDNDPYCLRAGKYEGVVEGMIDFLKECTLKDQMTLRLEGKDETFDVDADFVLSCVQDLHDFCFGTVVTEDCDAAQLQLPRAAAWPGHVLVQKV